MTPAAMCLLGLALLIGGGPAEEVRRRLSWLSTHRFRTAERIAPLRPRRSLLSSAAGSSGVMTGSIGLLGLVTALLAGPMVAILLCVVVTAVRGLAQRLSLDRRRDRSRSAIGAAIAALIDEYESGAGVPAALKAASAEAGPHQTIFRRAAAAAAAGNDGAATFLAQPDDHLVALGVALRVASRSGIPLVEVLSGVRGDVSHDRDLRRRVSSLLAGPRSSAALLATLPVLGLVLGSGLGANPAHVLLRTGAGSFALVAGVLLDLTGLWWTIALSRRAMP
jgi:tight adherence protein B